MESVKYLVFNEKYLHCLRAIPPVCNRLTLKFAQVLWEPVIEKIEDELDAREVERDEST